MDKKQLCRGFLASRVDRDAGRIMETRYAVLPDGSVLKSEEAPASNDFFAGKELRETALTMEDIRAMISTGAVEFIGNYPVPKT